METGSPQTTATTKPRMKGMPMSTNTFVLKTYTDNPVDPHAPSVTHTLAERDGQLVYTNSRFPAAVDTINYEYGAIPVGIGGPLRDAGLYLYMKPDVERLNRITSETERDAIRNGLIEYMGENPDDREELNKILEHLGMEPLCTRFEVTVSVNGVDDSFEVDGDDIQCTTEEQVKEWVHENIQIKITTKWSIGSPVHVEMTDVDEDCYEAEVKVTVEKQEA